MEGRRSDRGPRHSWGGVEKGCDYIAGRKETSKTVVSFYVCARVYVCVCVCVCVCV